ncbi:hypothetical protein ABPG74_004820 [Tetrahymena malaccensis]
MSQNKTTSYLNNFNYRENILHNYEDHKQFQMFPFKQRDSEVESGSYFQTSRRNLSEKNEETIQESIQDKTILQAINEVQNLNNQALPHMKLDRSCNLNFQDKKNISQIQNFQIFQSQKLEILNDAIDLQEVEHKKVQQSKLMNILKLLVNIQHFFRILSMNSRIFSKLTQHQHYLISDISSSYSKNQKLKKHGKKQNIFNNSLFILIELINKLNKYVFTPNSNLIKAWDSLQSLLIIFSTFLLNLELFFGMDVAYFQLLFQVIFVASIIDIFVELNTGVLKKGNIIIERNFILKSYLKNNLFINLIGNVPLFFYISKVEVSTIMRMLFNIFYVFKWIKVANVLKQIAFYVSYEKDHKNMFDLLKLLVFVIGICHIFCLFWHGLVMLEINNGITNNWLANKNLLDASIQERYIYSFYFLAVTMATVGYGDISPQNKFEVLFTTITIFVTCIVYAFSLNTIGAIIENIEKKNKKCKENLQVIHGLMREEEVSRNLKIKISDYIEYLYKESNEIQRKQEKLIIEKLSTKLRNDLNLEIQGKYLSNIPLFKCIKEKEKVAKIMEEQLYSPAETIFTQDDIDDCSLYYIVKGAVSIIFQSGSNSNREDKQVELLENKKYFGEISFITGNPRSFTAKATDFCKIYKIKREQFLSAVLQINNIESLSEILDSVGNEYYYQEQQENEVNFRQEIQIGSEKGIRFRNNTLSSNYISSKNDNIGSQIESIRKAQYSIEAQPEKTIEQLKRQSISHLSLANLQNNQQLNFDQNNQTQRQPKKSFLYSASLNQQLIQEPQKCDQLDLNQNSQIINAQLYPQSQSSLSQLSSSNNDISSKDIQSIENKLESNSKIQKNQQIADTVDEKQNQIQFQQKDDFLMQKRFSQTSQRRQSNQKINASKLFNSSQKNILLNPELNDQPQQNNKQYDQQKNNNNQQTNDRIINLIAFPNTKESQQENNLNVIQQNSTKITEAQVAKFINSQINFEPLTLKQVQQQSQNYSPVQLSQLSPKNSQNQLSLQNISKAIQATNSQNSSQFSKQNLIGVVVKSENKIQEAYESYDQVNYLMLQIFDKAKIFKFYQPHFNYTEIVQKFTQYQSEIQKNKINILKTKKQKTNRKQNQLLPDANIKKGNQRQSILYMNTQIEGQKEQQLSDTQVDRSCQRQLFELQNYKLQQFHEGDSGIEESSFQERSSRAVLELKHQSSTERTLQTNAADEIKQINMINYDQKNVEMEINVEFRNEINSQKLENEQSQQEIDFLSVNSSKVAKQSSFKINSTTQKCLDNQDQSKIVGSQNTIVNKEAISQKNNSEMQPSSQSKTEINDKIWLQEDIFYEKNFKKLGTKVTFAIKNKYQDGQQFNNSDKHQQNFKKAASIINKLLNTSMNRVMKIRQHVENFVNLLKLRRFNRRIDDLKENEYLIINDLSYFYNQNDKNIKSYQFQTIFNCFLRLMQVLPVFMPTDIIRVFWDIIQVIFTYSFLYIYSLLIFFDQSDFNSQFILRFYYFSLIMFIADIIINLNTAIFNKDNIITKRKNIAKQYFLSTIFFTDFLSLFALSSKVIYQSELAVQDQNDNLFKYGFNILIFLKVNGISHKKQRFNYIFTLTENQKHIIKLINQIASVITAAHIAAIGWYFLGIQEQQNNQSCWLDKLVIKDNPYYEKYAYSIYWSITTMTTGISLIYKNLYFNVLSSPIFIVGYGDIAATNYIEAFYISVVMILFSCVFAYSINNIGFILQEIEKSSKQLNDDITIIQRYLIRKDVNIQLKSRKNEECYQLFDSNENLLTSECTQSKYQNDDDDDDDNESLSQIPFYFDQQSINSQNLSKNYSKKKTEKLFSTLKKPNSIQQQLNIESESQLIQENQCHSNKSLNNQENFELKKAWSNTLCSYAKTQSLEAAENVNSNIKQESSFNSISTKNPQITENNSRAIYKNDTDYFKQNTNEIQSQLQNQQIEENQQKSTHQTANAINQSDYEKKQQKQGSYNSNLNIQYSNKILQQQPDDQFIKEAQIQQPGLIENQSKIMTSIKSRCSVEQMLLQNILLNGLICEKRFSQLQQINSQNYVSNIQDILDKYVSNTNKSIRDTKEKTSSQQSTSTSGKSFLQAEPQALSNSMDQFEKLQQFKKYFTHNNFEKVLSNLKKYQQQQKKLKKNKLAQKQRRCNIGLINNARLSIFHGNSNLVKFIPQEYDINQYKPTNLSYGIKMQNNVQFPINLQSITNN